MKKTKQKKQKVHWDIPEELFIKIADLAKKENRSITGTANMLLQKAIENVR